MYSQQRAAAISEWEEVEAHVTESVKVSHLFEEPYLHISLTNFFPVTLYHEILRKLPSNAYYRDLPHPDALRGDGTSIRLQLPLTDPTLETLPLEMQGFWRNLAQVLCSERLQTALFSRLAPDLERRFSCSAENVVGHPYPLLLRDSSGYRIRPHPDTPKKVLTVLLYLPSDHLQSDLGTAIYKVSNREPLTFATVRTIPYLPNSGLAFAVTNSSWHGRETLPDCVSERNTLALIYYTDNPNNHER